MPSLTPTISFDVRFLFTGFPTIQLTVNTTLSLSEQHDLTGYFSITQPDCITVNGSFDTPDIRWTGTSLNIFTKALRLGSDQLFQKGKYKITLYASHPDFTQGLFTREFIFDYKPAAQVIGENFDLFTPQLGYTDSTVYTKTDYAILSETESWIALTDAGLVTPSTTSSFDLIIAGHYYDSSYDVSYIKTIIYQNLTNTWLSISQEFIYEVTGIAYIPQNSATLIAYLEAIRPSDDPTCCDDLAQQLYDKALALYKVIRDKICDHSTTGLKAYFDEFYRLTHNYQSYSYTNTNGIIPVYDFTTGCSGGDIPSGETVVFEGIVGGEEVITGTINTLSGFIAGSYTLTLFDFIGLRVEMNRGGQDSPTIGPYAGFIKDINSDSILLAFPLIDDEYIKIKTIP